MQRIKFLSFLTCVLTAAIIAVSCESKPSKQTGADTQQILGTWTLKSRITDGLEAPATERLMRLTLNPDGTFRALYRGDETQNWIKAGQGAFAFEPPYVTLYWESGAVITIMVSQMEPDQLLVHHGRNLVPLKDQEPEEIFTRQKVEKGPTRGPS